MSIKIKRVFAVCMIVIVMAFPSIACSDNPTWSDNDSNIELQFGDAMGISSAIQNAADSK